MWELATDVTALGAAENADLVVADAPPTLVLLVGSRAHVYQARRVVCSTFLISSMIDFRHAIDYLAKDKAHKNICSAHQVIVPS